MIRYFKKLACMMLAVALPFAAFFTVLLAMPDHVSGIATTSHYKIELLKTTPAPRVIFAGGSSSPYGTVCAEVSRQLEVNAITVGITAYLGLDYYLQMLDSYAVKGDTVVLAPEHFLLCEDSVNYLLVWESLNTDTAVWRCVPPHYLPGLFASALDYYEAKKQALSGTFTGDKRFGPLGDVTEERVSQMESGYNTQDLSALCAERVSDTILKKIRRFAAKMEKRGVTVYFAFAPLDRLAVTTSAAENAAFETKVREGVGVPVILSLSQAVMDAEYFYDTNNHLTSAGALINTQNMIDGLRAAGQKT